MFLSISLIVYLWTCVYEINLDDVDNDDDDSVKNFLTSRYLVKSCHSATVLPLRDCKALLDTGLTHVSSAIASTRPIPLSFYLYLSWLGSIGNVGLRRRRVMAQPGYGFG